MFDVKDSDFFELEDEAFDTIVENDISFSGNVRVRKPFMIRGIVNGRIDAVSDLVIDTGASVSAEISASRVLIKGSVHGNITGADLVFVTSSGSLDGDIVTRKVVLEPGCVFTGRCSMLTDGNGNEK